MSNNENQKYYPSKFYRRITFMMFFGMGLLMIAFTIPAIVNNQAAKNYEQISAVLFESESSCWVHVKTQKIKEKPEISSFGFDFDVFPEFPILFNKYGLWHENVKGETIAFLSPQAYRYAGRIVRRSDYQELDNFLRKYENENPGIAFSNNVIVAEYTDYLKITYIIMYSLIAISLIMGIISWRMTKRHFLLPGAFDKLNKVEDE